MALGFWRVGRHYGIHVYEGDRPVATFHTAAEAAEAVAAVNAARETRAAAESAGIEPAPGSPRPSD